MDPTQISHLALDIGGTLIKLVYFSANEDYSEESRNNGSFVVQGRLCFARFETRKIDDCLEFIRFNIIHHSDLQLEMENARKKMVEDEKKPEHMKAKYKTYTEGHQRRAETVWTQIEATLKQIEIGGTEIECFKALKRQEEMAASFRKNYLQEEVLKQKHPHRI